MTAFEQHFVCDIAYCEAFHGTRIGEHAAFPAGRKNAGKSGLNTVGCDDVGGVDTPH